MCIKNKSNSGWGGESIFIKHAPFIFGAQAHLCKNKGETGLWKNDKFLHKILVSISLYFRPNHITIFLRILKITDPNYAYPSTLVNEKAVIRNCCSRIPHADPSTIFGTGAQNKTKQTKSKKTQKKTALPHQMATQHTQYVEIRSHWRWCDMILSYQCQYDVILCVLGARQ